MFERLAEPGRDVLVDARAVARELGSPTVEAEHLLLAAARRPDGPLAESGLDYDSLLEALETERAVSLAAVGVTLDPGPASPPVGEPRWATSAKVAIQRAMHAAVGRGDKHIDARHVAIGVLRAQLGTVPRALECAGVDRIGLLTWLEAN